MAIGSEYDKGWNRFDSENLIEYLNVVGMVRLSTKVKETNLMYGDVLERNSKPGHGREGLVKASLVFIEADEHDLKIFHSLL